MPRRDPRQRSPSPRILVAGTDDAIRVITRALDGEAYLLPARRVAEALRLAGADVDALVCDLRFDDSRLFALLRALAERQPAQRLPIVCCHWRQPASPLAREAIATALDSHGVRARIDVRSLVQRYGSALAGEILCRLIMTRIRAAPRPAHGRASSAHRADKRLGARKDACREA